MDSFKLTLLLIPLVTSFITSSLCKMNRNVDIPATPPGWVFSIVWTTLYLLLGWIWVNNYQNTIINGLIIAIIILLNMWIYMYNCKKNAKIGLYIILALLVLTLGLNSYLSIPEYKLMTVPLIGWLIFALMLNYTVVNTTNQ
jgi:translocator protein